ncbi:MAG: dihydroorotase [Candidatus Diapherotrites archaeon]|nr:dihydroorotase [Candidatus Diapherotrites archaeon]
MHELVLKSCKTFYRGKLTSFDIGVDSGKIVALGKGLEGEQKIDCSHKLVFPGLIDVHVHFRTPGAEYKEDWVHASRAALHGGITTVLDMPNNTPAICSEKTLGMKEEIVSKNASVDYGFYLGASTDSIELDEKITPNFAAFKLYMASTTGDMVLDSPNLMFKVFRKAARLGKVIAVHAEDESIIKKNISLAKQRNKYSLCYHHEIRSANAEAVAIERVLKFAEQTNAFLHICHISSAAGLKVLKDAKLKRLRFSCGVTPHHLFLTNKDVEKLGNIAKVNPSIKTSADRKALWQALNSGMIDVIETDHAPHAIKEKQRAYEEAPSGIPGIETMLPLLLDAHNRKLLSLETIFNCCCKNPARIFGLKTKGKIDIGCDADFCIVDLKREQRIGARDLHTKCGFSPFENRRVKGVVEKTIVRGTLCFDSGEFVEAVKGRNLFGVFCSK